ncbi:Uncharacterized protein FWK35_00020327 [Aphis craccivora]|uniref:Uncharacterized protein n=1 Tax=Aphis craccivora TaxID=307492 RepID=A0A6G0Y3E4_APHCR|nr:Uncharacterized protein FWK35_00020327 [Aphis craccivora]
MGTSIYMHLFIYNSLMVTLRRDTSISKMSSGSERSDKCIEFTMNITSRNNAPISNFGGGFQCKIEYPWCII